MLIEFAGKMVHFAAIADIVTTEAAVQFATIVHPDLNNVVKPEFKRKNLVFVKNQR
jgi:hypothetical protein